MTVVRRVAMLSLHTSPLEQPGAGDAGGMNVYIKNLATQLSQLGVDVHIFTRYISADQPHLVHMRKGVVLHHVIAGPPRRISKEELPNYLSEMVNNIMSCETAGTFEVIHGHYWLSGMVGLQLADAWDIPSLFTSHTLGHVKNQLLDVDDTPEPAVRLAGERAVAHGAKRLIVNTRAEEAEFLNLYDADRSHIDVVEPGADLDVFQPAFRTASRLINNIPAGVFHIVFAGRIQRLKGPHVLIEAIAELCKRRSDIPVLVTIIGAHSGAAELDLDALIAQHNLADVVTLHDAVVPTELAHWFRSADVVVVPSFSESFGLVALEAQACGTPVIARNVGGLAQAVLHGRTGLLVDSFEAGDWADALIRLFDCPDTRTDMGRAASMHAQQYGWNATAAKTLNSYIKAINTPVEDSPHS